MDGTTSPVHREFRLSLNIMVTWFSKTKVTSIGNGKTYSGIKSFRLDLILYVMCIHMLELLNFFY